APDANRPITALLLFLQNFFEDTLLKQLELRPVAKEARFVDGQIFEQQSQLVFAFAAGQQAVVVVEGIQLAGFEAPQQAVLQEVRTPLVKEHAAFLIDERLEKL